MKSTNIDQIKIEEFSNKDIYFSIIESLLFASGEPLKVEDIGDIIECSIPFTKDLLNYMILRYSQDDRGIKLINVNNTYQLVTKPRNSEYVQKLLKTNVRQSLSQAALETLSIIAYKQPITRIEIDEIRGVKSDRAVLTLSEKNLIRETGRMDVPGRPILYSTTDEFLKFFGLENLNQMPQLEALIDKYGEEEGD
ncbi:MAG: chromosome segregation and condensation protein ScpB [Clostridiaceae bacterium]|jgi:segregation and condensation protein B|nr:chromosome segregation and condensation protein ScpB [Clostridiaceae bacterium]